MRTGGEGGRKGKRGEGRGRGESVDPAHVHLCPAVHVRQGSSHTSRKCGSTLVAMRPSVRSTVSLAACSVSLSAVTNSWKSSLQTCVTSRERDLAISVPTTGMTLSLTELGGGRQQDRPHPTDIPAVRCCNLCTRVSNAQQPSTNQPRHCSDTATIPSTHPHWPPTPPTYSPPHSALLTCSGPQPVWTIQG